MSMYGPPQGAPFGGPQGQPFGGPQGPVPGMGPPKKKGLSTGCLVALVVVLSGFALVLGTVIYVGVKLSQNKDVQNVMGAIGDAAEIAAEAQRAPGTAELRALGCDQAMVLDPMKMMKIADRFADAGADPPMAPPDVDRIVTCSVGSFGTAPSCEAAAKAYVRGASPSKQFMLTIQQRHGRTPCGGVYSADGTLLRPIDEGAH